MFAVVDKPCSPKAYNSLPEIMEADAAIEPIRSDLTQLIQHGSEACRSTLFARGAIGAFLLHKHWKVQEGECMIEHPGSHPSGKPALVTSVQRFTGPSSVAPSRFKIDPQRRELVALEFSSDHFVIQVWRDLVAHPTLLQGICSLVGDGGLADQIGFAIFARAAVQVAQGEEFVEENWNERSVLSAQVLVNDGQSAFVPTGWPFVSVSDADATTASCIAYCMSAAGLHCRHHYDRPEGPEQ